MQHGCSVRGYARPSAEILIKASWHLKSSVTRQPIWAKRARCCLSHIKPTLETGVIQANKVAGKSRHLRWRCDVRCRFVVTARQEIGFPGPAVCYAPHAVCVNAVCCDKTDGRDTERWPLTSRRWWLPVQKRSVGAEQVEQWASEDREGCHCLLSDVFRHTDFLHSGDILRLRVP